MNHDYLYANPATTTTADAPSLHELVEMVKAMPKPEPAPDVLLLRQSEWDILKPHFEARLSDPVAPIGGMKIAVAKSEAEYWAMLADFRNRNLGVGVIECSEARP